MQLKAFSRSAVTTCPRAKALQPSCKAPLEGALRSSWSFLFSKLNGPSSQSGRGINLEALLWTCYSKSRSFLYWRPREWTQLDGKAWAAVEYHSPGCSLPHKERFKCHMWLHSPPVFTWAFLPLLKVLGAHKGEVMLARQHLLSEDLVIQMLLTIS